MLLGRALRSDRLHETLLPKRIALPVFASDALSSMPTRPRRSCSSCRSAGSRTTAPTARGSAAGVVLMLLRGRRVVPAERACLPERRWRLRSRDHQPRPARRGLVVASALMVDYVLTVAVSIAAGVDNLALRVCDASTSHESGCRSRRSPLLTAHEPARRARVRDRVRDPDLRVHARHLRHGAGVCAAADRPGTSCGRRRRLECCPEDSSFTGLALVFLVAARVLLRLTTALTGVEAISNGVPAFRKPKSRETRRRRCCCSG